MVQAFSPPTLALSLTPMQSSQAVASSTLSLKESKNDDDVKCIHLLLHPGKVGEMLVIVENLGDYPVHSKLEISGNFQSDWCHCQGGNFQEIAPHSKIERTITFGVPSDFFENQQALLEKPQLQINYINQVSVYTCTDNTQQLAESQNFNILIRPQSSYQDFLPTIYREVDFIERFLSIMEQAFDPAVQTIENLCRAGSASRPDSR